MHVYTPLWGRDRTALLQRLLELGMKVRFSAVDTRWLDAAWVGRELDSQALDELQAIRKLNGLDLCGEEGEYHTLVVDGPRFMGSVSISAYSTGMRDSLAYMEISNDKGKR